MLVKPQGGFFIVAIYILLRRDWLGVLISLLVYGLPFWKFYPAWVEHMISTPPSPQQVAPQSIMGRFGLPVALFLAVWVSLARRWKYWQLGGALAGILAPYGMPGIPVFLTLAAVGNLASIPVVIVFSALLAGLTWITPPPGVRLLHLPGVNHVDLSPVDAGPGAGPGVLQWEERAGCG